MMSGSGGAPKEQETVRAAFCRGVLDVDSSIKLRFCDHDRAHGICAWAIDRMGLNLRGVHPVKRPMRGVGKMHYTHRQEESRRLCHPMSALLSASSCSSIALNHPSRPIELFNGLEIDDARSDHCFLEHICLVLVMNSLVSTFRDGRRSEIVPLKLASEFLTDCRVTCQNHHRQ